MAESQQREEKLKPLLNDLPPGYLVNAAWLVARKIDRKSIFNYVEHGWLEKVAHGIYRRPDPEIFAEDRDDWHRAILSIQHLMRWPCHVGGQTAMALAGFEHYVRFDDSAPIYLYGKTPSWIKRLPNANRFRYRTNALFENAKTGVTGTSDDSEGNLDQASAPRHLMQSTPERAILEWLNELPNKTTWHSINVVFEGLATLRPKLLMSLLQDCRSIKVKQSFFDFADHHNHAWHKHLEKGKIYIGSGSLVEKGKWPPEYSSGPIPDEVVEEPGDGAQTAPELEPAEEENADGGNANVGEANDEDAEDREATFVRLARSRHHKVVKGIRLLGKLGNRACYKYDEERVRVMFEHLREELDDAEKKFALKHDEEVIFDPFADTE